MCHLRSMLQSGCFLMAAPYNNNPCWFPLLLLAVNQKLFS